MLSTRLDDDDDDDDIPIHSITFWYPKIVLITLCLVSHWIDYQKQKQNLITRLSNLKRLSFNQPGNIFEIITKKIGAMAKELDCGLDVSDFEIQSPYSVHFRTNTLRKGMNLLISPATGYIAPLLFFYKNAFGIKEGWYDIKQRNQPSQK